MKADVSPTCPQCGRELSDPRMCSTPSWVCGWTSDNYEPTDAELAAFYDRTSSAERLNALHRQRQEIGR